MSVVFVLFILAPSDVYCDWLAQQLRNNIVHGSDGLVTPVIRSDSLLGNGSWNPLSMSAITTTTFATNPPLSGSSPDRPDSPGKRTIQNDSNSKCVATSLKLAVALISKNAFLIDLFF